MDATGTPTAPANQTTDSGLLKEYLADRDVPCPACKYNIRGLEGNHCPECGRELKLTVGVIGLSNIWITALVGALIPAGCGIPFIVGLLIAFAYGASVHDITSEPEGVIFLTLVFYALCCILFSILLLVMRQRFMRLKEEAQRGIAGSLIIAALLATFVAIALLGSL